MKTALIADYTTLLGVLLYLCVLSVQAMDKWAKDDACRVARSSGWDESKWCGGAK